MYMRNRIGPSTVLRGTPGLTLIEEDLEFSKATLWMWFVKKDSIHLEVWPLMPYQFSL